jgi:hypothetical protein
VSRIDPLVLNCGNLHRGLFRLAMGNLLPYSVRTRRDKARFEPAIAEAALAGDGMSTLRDLSSVAGLASLGLINPDHFRVEAQACLAAVSRGMAIGPDLLGGRWERFWRTVSAERTIRTWGGAVAPPHEALP